MTVPARCSGSYRERRRVQQRRRRPRDNDDDDGGDRRSRYAGLFAESRLHRQVQRIYLVPVSGMERDRERKREKRKGRHDELDAVETFSCVVSRRDSLT